MFKDFSVFPNVSFENKHYEEYYQRSHRVGYRRKQELLQIYRQNTRPYKRNYTYKRSKYSSPEKSLRTEIYFKQVSFTLNKKLNSNMPIRKERQQRMMDHLFDNYRKKHLKNKQCIILTGIYKNNTSYCSKDNKVKACAEKKKGPTCWRFKSRADCAPTRRAHINITKIHSQRVCASGQTITSSKHEVKVLHYLLKQIRTGGGLLK